MKTEKGGASAATTCGDLTNHLALHDTARGFSTCHIQPEGWPSALRPQVLFNDQARDPC